MEPDLFVCFFVFLFRLFAYLLALWSAFVKLVLNWKRELTENFEQIDDNSVRKLMYVNVIYMEQKFYERNKKKRTIMNAM